MYHGKKPNYDDLLQFSLIDLISMINQRTEYYSVANSIFYNYVLLTSSMSDKIPENSSKHKKIRENCYDLLPSLWSNRLDFRARSTNWISFCRKNPLQLLFRKSLATIPRRRENASKRRENAQLVKILSLISILQVQFLS